MNSISFQRCLKEEAFMKFVDVEVLDGANMVKYLINTYECSFLTLVVQYSCPVCNAKSPAEKVIGLLTFYCF